MEKVNTAKSSVREHTNRTVLFSIGLYIAAVLFLLPAAAISDPILSDIAGACLRMTAAVLIIVLSGKLFQTKIGIRKEGTVKRFFWYGLVMLPPAGIMQANQQDTLTRSFGKALPTILMQFVCYMTVGRYKEAVFRGLLFQNFRKHFGNTKKGIVLAVFLSSLLFGVTHLVNLVSHPELVLSTGVQVIYAFFFGTLFCALYYRYNNLLPCILLHGVFDFCSSFWDFFTSKSAETASADMSISDAVTALVLTLPLFICGILQFRKLLKTAGESHSTAITAF